MKSIRLPTQKQYPKKIYFNAECYRIVYKKRLKFYGETDATRKVITIKDGLSPRQLLHTLVHELLHLAEFEHPVKLKHKTVYKLESAIVQILLDNFL